MQEADPLIRTKLRQPFIRPGLVSRPRLQQQIAQGLRGPLTLIAAPAGFGKTTLVASCVAGCGMLVAWLALDKDDNRAGRFLNYVVAALHEADQTIGSEAAQLLAAQQAPPEAVLTSLINDLDRASGEIALVLDDYQFIKCQPVHEAVAFLLEHCPKTLHLVIASRSDPALPLARLRARGQMTELRAADLSFSEPETAQFLNEVMGLGLDVGSIVALNERTEGWIAGLQMASIAMQSHLSLRDRRDVAEFIAGFSGTNRYILDYLLEEVLASQPPEIQRFLLRTSILERLTAPLCDAVIDNGRKTEDGTDSSLVFRPSSDILEYLDRANLFLTPLDDERIWYRYHHLFADLLRSQLQRSLGAQEVAQLHVRAADWHGQNGSLAEAIHHASMAADDERLERLIEQNYAELVGRGEQSGLRSWTSGLSKELVYRRPRLCIYEAYSHSWFGELDEADRLLDEAEHRIHSEPATPDHQAMLGLLVYVRSRVTAMRGDTHRAIELCLAARAYAPAGNVALQLDTRITLGYAYFLNGDYANAGPILDETIRTGIASGAIINTVAAACLLARLHAVQGLLHKSYEVYQTTARLISGTGGQHLGARALLEVGMAEALYEWNDLDTALAHMKQGLELMPWWGKADDFILANVTLARIHLAHGDKRVAAEAVERTSQLIRTRGVFCEARQAAEVAQVRLWLAQGDLQAAAGWAASLEKRLGAGERSGFAHELAHIAQARVLIALHRPDEALGLLAQLEETTRSAGRLGRLIEILLLKALALQATGDLERAVLALTQCLTLAAPERYVRLFLDEGRPMQMLLAQWLTPAGAGPLRDYAIHLLRQFAAESCAVAPAQGAVLPPGHHAASSGWALVEPLSQRELEVLHLIALGRTNQEIAGQLIISPGTVKAHTASIYRKLDVANRTEAAACARRLGILP